MTIKSRCKVVYNNLKVIPELKEVWCRGVSKINGKDKITHSQYRIEDYQLDLVYFTSHRNKKGYELIIRYYGRNICDFTLMNNRYIKTNRVDVAERKALKIFNLYMHIFKQLKSLCKSEFFNNLLFS